MKIGLMVDTIWPHLSYQKKLKKVSEMGLKGIQLWHRDITQNFSLSPAEFVRFLKNDLGLELVALSAYTDFLNPMKAREAIVRDFKEIVSYAAQAKVRFVITESGGRPREMDKWEELISRLSEIGNYCEEQGVFLLVENGPGVLVDNIDLMIRLIGELNNDFVKINFDPANLNLVSGDVVEAVKKLKDLIVCAHAKDSILVPAGSGRKIPEEHVFIVPEGEEFINIPPGVKWVLPPLGEGDVPFPQYLKALQEIGYQGYLIIEYQGGGKRGQNILKCKHYLEKLLAQL